MADVPATALALAAFGFFFAGLVKGAVGLGFASTCLPFLVLALGLDRAMPLVLIPSLSSNMMVHYQAGHFGETIRFFWPMFLATVPGLLLGLWLLTTVDLDNAAAVLGAVLAVYGIWTLLHAEVALEPRWVNQLRPPVGFLTGLVNGLTGSQILPILPYLLSQSLPRPVFLQAINTSFTFSSLIVALGLWQIGFLTLEIAAYSAAALLPMILGVTLGTAIRNRMSSDTFRTAVLVVLVLLGTLLMLRGLT